MSSEDPEDRFAGCICYQDDHRRDCPAIKTEKCRYQSLYSNSNRCSEHCPSCNRLCTGIKDHLEETKMYQTPETEYHACGLHVWVSPPPGQKLRIDLYNSTIKGSNATREEIVEMLGLDKEEKPIRGINLKE